MPGLKYDRAFMYYWKAKFGFGDPSKLQLSDYTWTDDGFYCLYEISESKIGTYTHESTDTSWIYYKLLEIIGNQVDALYGLPNAYNMWGQSGINVMYRTLPSLQHSAPNLQNLIINEYSSYYHNRVYMHILSTGRIIYKYNLIGMKALINGTTLPSGNWKSAYSIGEYYFNPHKTDPYFYLNFMCIKKFNNPQDLLDPDNYIFVQVLLSQGTTGYTQTIKVYENGYPGSSRENFITELKYFWSSNPPEPDGSLSPNPFEPIGPSVPDIPGGKFDNESDIIGDSDLPSLSASDTGFTRIYIPTLSQVQDLARYLWTDETVVETIWNKIKQFFENPMEAIIGFNLVPVPVPSSGTKSFALMYIDTGVDMDTAANQFVDVDCGTFKLEYYYGSALDYSPYTKVSCFLPYIGMVQLNTDEVMNRTLQIKYRIDIVSGSCVAKILVDGNCIYQYSGHCAITIPISASDFTSYVSAAISVAKLAVGAAVGGAGGALSALAGAPTASQQTNQVITQTQTETAHYNAEGAFTGASITNRTQTRESPKNQSSTESSFAGLTPANISNTVGEIMGSKPHVQHSGSFSGNSGYLGVRRPFLIIERPNLCLPENYQQLNGFPAMITMLLGECSGYTRVQQVELTGLPATNPEQAEILELLKSGVIF